MNIVFDTNIILDVLLIREPHFQKSANLFDAVVNQTIQGYLCATTLTTMDYFIAKQYGKQQAREFIAMLLDSFLIAEVNQAVLIKASESDFSDFEDAVLYQSGVFVGVNGFVTRNKKDFNGAILPIYTPDELLAILSNNSFNFL